MREPDSTMSDGALLIQVGTIGAVLRALLVGRLLVASLNSRGDVTNGL